MEKNEIKQKLFDAIDSMAEDIKAYADDIAKHAELGWFENRTSDRFAEELTKFGLKAQRGLAVTGVRADIKSDKQGPNVAVLGELDGIICRAHPDADPESGATHQCGHNLQTSMALLVAGAFAKTGLIKELSGSLSIFGVPAEEFIDITRRKQLHDEGKIVFFSGKPELIRRGAFDDVDMAMMVHSGGPVPERTITIPDSGNGFRIFMLQIKGVQAHAAAAPHDGINALHAAIAGINAVNALRETFRDEDHVRVHYIITKGGDSANCIPDDVRLEGYVRAVDAKTMDVVFEKVMKAFKSAAESIGAECFVTSIPGEMPLNPSLEMNKLFAENSRAIVGDNMVTEHTVFAASTDMGDIMQIMPAIHGFTGGTVGTLHSAEFHVVDFEAAVLVPAKAMASTIVDLLAGDAGTAKEIISAFKPVYTKEEYLAAMNARFYSEI